VPPRRSHEGDALGAAITARTLILQRLKTLREMKPALQSFATVLATKTKFMRNDYEVVKIAGLAPDVFVVPRCAHCHGFNGASHRGEPPIPCSPCEGTGHRLGAVGKGNALRAFGAELLRQMDRMLGVAASGIAKSLHD
jgi:hypothetical protein